MRRTAMVIAATLLAVLIASCGNGEVGEFLEVINPQVSIEGKDTTDDSAELHEDDDVTTDTTGEVEFSLNEKVEICHVYDNSGLTVHPLDSDGNVEALIHFWDGVTWCRTEAGTTCDGSGCDYQVTDSVIELSDDPIFGVAVDGDVVTVKVKVGVARVISPEGVVDVPGGFQTVIEPGRPPLEPIELILLPFETGFVDSLEVELDISRPSISSESLERAIGDESLIVWVDEGQIQDSGTQGFIVGFFEYLASEWGIEATDIRFESVESAKAQVNDGASGVIVTPFGIDEYTQSPLFRDTAGEAWQLIGLDSDATTALNDFLAGAVQLGDYDRLYRAAFDRPPDLGLFDRLLFP